MYQKFKETLEVITLVAGCVAFFTYISGGEARKTEGVLQTLQLSELCQSLAHTVDGSAVWNAQEPLTFEGWDQANAALDQRIEFLNQTCDGIPNYVAPTRVIPGVEVEDPIIYSGEARFYQAE